MGATEARAVPGMVWHNSRTHSEEKAPILGGTFIQCASQIFPLLSSTHTAGCSSQKFTYQELVPFIHLSKKLIKRLVRAKYQARLQERLKDE